MYIHIPFCDSKCFYCSFNSYTDSFHLKKAYMQALLQEIKTKINLYEIKFFDTIFFGGGTPSAIDIAFYEPIFELLKKHKSDQTEVTFEANPNSATQKWLEDIKSFGANRISFGVQSFDDEKLKFLGRAHNGKKAIEALELASKIGFDSINFDILYNVDNDSKKLIQSDILNAKKLNSTHISAYSLTIEEKTKFFEMKKIENQNEEFSRFCIETIKDAGFMQYEISNFALNSSFISKHNLGYWSGYDYLGCGAGAVECIKNIRRKNVDEISQYINNYSFNEEFLSDIDKETEAIFLGLRSCVGISQTKLSQKNLQNAKFLVQEKKLRFENGRFFNDDFLISDELALFVMR